MYDIDPNKDFEHTALAGLIVLEKLVFEHSTRTNKKLDLPVFDKTMSVCKANEYAAYAISKLILKEIYEEAKNIGSFDPLSWARVLEELSKEKEKSNCHLITTGQASPNWLWYWMRDRSWRDYSAPVSWRFYTMRRKKRPECLICDVGIENIYGFQIHGRAQITNNLFLHIPEPIIVLVDNTTDVSIGGSWPSESPIDSMPHTYDYTPFKYRLVFPKGFEAYVIDIEEPWS